MTAHASVWEFQVQGHLDPRWAEQLGNLTIDHHDDGSSTLTGPVTDQAQLHGWLGALRDIGAPLLSLRMAPDRSKDQIEEAAITAPAASTSAAAVAGHPPPPSRS